MNNSKEVFNFVCGSAWGVLCSVFLVSVVPGLLEYVCSREVAYFLTQNIIGPLICGASTPLFGGIALRNNIPIS